jgi:hypothetical protein
VTRLYQLFLEFKSLHHVPPHRVAEVDKGALNGIRNPCPSTARLFRSLCPLAIDAMGRIMGEQKGGRPDGGLDDHEEASSACTFAS